MIGIIDYKTGNSVSVKNALDYMGIPSKLTQAPGELAKCSHIILPGAGSAGATMELLAELNLIEALKTHTLIEKKPFLGICVGMQVLFERSEEGDARCLGWLAGRVAQFDETRLRVPQIGWNLVEFVRAHPVTDGLGGAQYFYFVNSYYAKPSDSADVLGMTDYGAPFCSMVARENIIASQFHIEKSGEIGLRLLKNFANL